MKWKPSAFSFLCPIKWQREVQAFETNITLTFVAFGTLKNVFTSFSLNLFLYNLGLGEGMADKSSFHSKGLHVNAHLHISAWNKFGKSP